MNPTEVYISVDVETAGPIPGEFDMLSLGACLVDAPEKSFYAEFRPFAPRCDEEALSISGLSMERLTVDGERAEDAMSRFSDWIGEQSTERCPVFVGFNAPFDWSFVNWYFHRFLGRNPFGFSALDIKAFYMGLWGCRWSDTSSSKLADEFKSERQLEHNSLVDAQVQAGIFARMLAYRKSFRVERFEAPEG